MTHHASRHGTPASPLLPRTRSYHPLLLCSLPSHRPIPTTPAHRPRHHPPSFRVTRFPTLLQLLRADTTASYTHKPAAINNSPLLLNSPRPQSPIRGDSEARRSRLECPSTRPRLESSRGGWIGVGVGGVRSGEAAMGRLFLMHLEGNFYSCKHCKTHLGLAGDIISKSFHSKHGKAYLFQKVVNVTPGVKEDRPMMTGMHTVCDIFCVGCGAIVGWKYEAAHEKSQRYKEGKYILERFKVVGPDGSQYWIAHDAHLVGSDADDI